MAKVIEGILPRAIMMENVPGVANRGKPILDEFLKVISKLGYRYTWRIEQMADYGVPQSRRRLVLLAGLGFEIPFPKPTHAQSPARGIRPSSMEYSKGINQSHGCACLRSRRRPTMEDQRRMTGTLSETFSRK